MRPFPALLLLLAALAAVGCGSPAPKTVRTVSAVEAPFVGTWTGNLAPRPKGQAAGDGVAMSDGLLRRLGGFTLDLRADNSFQADFLGLKREGRWTAAANSVTLNPERVLGLTRDAAEKANQSAPKGPAPNDLRQFEPQTLTFVGDALELTGDGEGAETVLFRRGQPAEKAAR